MDSLVKWTFSNADNTLMHFFILIFGENKARHFMWIALFSNIQPMVNDYNDDFVCLDQGAQYSLLRPVCLNT